VLGEQLPQRRFQLAALRTAEQIVRRLPVRMFRSDQADFRRDARQVVLAGEIAQSAEVDSIVRTGRRSVRVSGGWVDPGFLALEIRPTYVLKGRAVLPSGEPAAGVRIRALSSIFYENLRTPADGRFQMTVRGGGESACLLVVDPSKAARLVAVPASESEQDVPVALSPGILSLEFTPRGTRSIGALIASGCKLSWFQFRDLPQIVSGSTVTVMKSTIRVSAGAYALCALEYGDFDEDADIPPEACVSGVLPPDGTLQLRLNP